MAGTDILIDNAVTQSVFSNFAKYWWVLVVFLVIGTILGLVGLFSKINSTKKQWTHKLIVRRELPNNKLSDPTIILMKRYVNNDKHITKLFQLKTPLLGSYLIPELPEYSGLNEYSIIVTKSNRVFINTGEIFNPEANSVFVSSRHAEIDLQIEDLTKTVKVVNQTAKKLDWSQIAKYGIMLIAIIAVSIIAINGIQQWGATQEARAQSEIAQAEAMAQLSDAMDTMQAVVNTQQLELTPIIKLMYNTSNIQQLINQTR
jgi:hypothetical protein